MNIKERISEFEYFQKRINDHNSINIIGNEREYLIIEDKDNNFISKIHTSLINSNHIIIDNAMIIITKELYNELFKDNILNHIKFVVNERKNIILNNISLFIQHKSDIIDNEKFRNILASDYFFDSNLTRLDDRIITLGEILQLWDKEPEFSEICECKGRGYVYNFGGSALSGSFTKEIKCVKCEKKYSIEYKEKDNCYWEVVTIRRKYFNTEYINYDINILKNLVKEYINVNII